MLKPCWGNLLIEMIKEDDDFSNLIIRSNVYKDIENRGRVIAKGDGCVEDIPLGATVIIDVMTTEEIKEHIFKQDGKLLFVIRESWAICYWVD